MSRLSSIALAGLLLSVVSLFALPAKGLAETISSAECLECHGVSGDEDIPFVADSMLTSSVHADLECVECHAGIEELPHEEVSPVECGDCHEDEKLEYTRHGRGTVGKTEDLPKCTDCHGTHHILHSTDKESPTHSINLPETCGKCHADLDLAKKHDIRVKRPVETYEASVHGKTTHMGIHVAATCTDCHSRTGSGHDIWPQGDTESSVNHFRIPFTCGKCHGSIEQDYWEGVHGQLVLRGDTDAPVCTHCHGEHGILRADDPRAGVSPARIAEATCVPCHESAFLNEKYGIPAGTLVSFVDSYHGLKSRAGDKEVANCASCHGSHRILPSSDPESSVNPANLEKTCGHCHPGVTESLASTKIHGGGVGRNTGWTRVVSRIYIVAIWLIIGGMVLYVAIDFQKHVRLRMNLPQVKRMTPGAVAQHWILLISFTVLAFSGFALRYPEFGPFSTLFGWDGGSHFRGTLHRSAAVFFLFSCAWHLLYLVTRSGSRFLKDIAPGLRDFREFGEMMAFNLGRRKERARFGRFSYVEKAEYWALVWGAVIMAITGILLWFDYLFIRFLPKGFLDVMLVVHHYEAWLATLAILVWHMYSVIFNPAVFPGNPSWLTGRMPVEMYAHEHPGDAATLDEKRGDGQEGGTI